MELWDILDERGYKTGKTIERGQPLGADEFNLVVHIWIANHKNEFLISRRAPDKEPDSNMWESTRGCAIMGDDSISAAIREVKEELGITLLSENGKFLKRYKSTYSQSIVDVWFFRQEIDISTVVFQPEETIDAMWATKDTINKMIDDGEFIPKERIPYIDELL